MMADGKRGIMIKFGVCIPQDGLAYERIKKIALRSEKLGFDSTWLFDHLHSFPQPDKDPFFECWTTLSALAEATTQLRLGSLVLNAQYRNPALLAKMAATLDNISNGRLEFGIGAGGTVRAEWSEKLGYTAEYRAYGMDFLEKPSARIRKLEEAIQIIKKLWSEDKVTFEGKYYTVKNAFCYPKPVQKPHPPIWIGGMGEKLMLKVMAKLADGCNFAWSLSPEEYAKKLSILNEYCKIFGRPISSIRKSFLTACVLGDSPKEVRRILRDIAKDYNNIKGYVPYALRKGALIGTTEECARKISEFEEVGVNYFMLVFPLRHIERSIEKFARTIMPSF